MERLLNNSSIDLDKKLIACQNAFHIIASSEKEPIIDGTEHQNSQSKLINKIRNDGLERVSVEWLLQYLDIEIKPPTSSNGLESYKLEKQEREKVWFCLINICKTYPNIIGSIFLGVKPLPCEFVVKSISEAIEPETSSKTRTLILQWVLEFMFSSNCINSALFRQPLLYNQAISKLINIQKNLQVDTEENSFHIKTVLVNYKKFLVHIHESIAEGGSFDLDSIEGNFLEVAFPALIENNDNEKENEISTILKYYQYDNESCDLISDILGEILFKGENNISDWKDFLYSLTVADRKPCPKNDHIEKLLYILNQNTNHASRVFKALPLLLGSLCKATEKSKIKREGINAISGFSLKECALFFVMCCHILKIGPSAEDNASSPIILEGSLAACKLPTLSDQELQFGRRIDVFATLVNLVAKFASSSSIISVEFNTSADDNLGNTTTLLMWLKFSLKNFIESLKSETTSDEGCCVDFSRKTNFIRALLCLDSRIVEPLIGPILTNILFLKRSKCRRIPITPLTVQRAHKLNCQETTACSSAKSQFLKDLLLTYGKLRQIPKLIAKLFMCLQIKEDSSNVSNNEGSGQKYLFSASNIFTANDLNTHGNYFSKLPSGQLIEVFKTCIYHLDSIEMPTANLSLLSQNDRKSEYFVAVANLANQLIPCFLENSIISDHSVPISTKEKFAQLMIQMYNDLKLKFISDLELVGSILHAITSLASLMMYFDSSDLNLEIKNGLENIIAQNKSLGHDTKLLERVYAFSLKRKSASLQTKDKKRKRKSIEISSLSNSPIDDEVNINDWDLQNEVMNNIDNLKLEDFYRIAQLTWKWVRDLVKSDDYDYVKMEAPSWLSTLMNENISFQNGIIRVGIEVFETYILSDTSLTEEVKKIYQLMNLHASQNLETNCQLISKKKASPKDEFSCDCSICQISQSLEKMLLPERFKKRGHLKTQMKNEDLKSFMIIFGSLLPLEHVKGSTETITSLFLIFVFIMLPMEKEFQKEIAICLLKCWDTTYRYTNTLWYMNFGRLLRAICQTEKTLDSGELINADSITLQNISLQERLPLTLQLSKIGISLQSNSMKSNALLDFNDSTLETMCNALESTFDSKHKHKPDQKDDQMIESDTLCAVILMQSIETVLSYTALNDKSANQKKNLQDKSKQLAYFNALAQSFLVSLKHMDCPKSKEISPKTIGIICGNSAKSVNDFDKMIVMIRAATAYSTTQNHPSITLDSKFLTSNSKVIMKHLKYLVDFALAVISSLYENANETLKKSIKLCDIKQCFNFLQTVSKHPFAIASEDNEKNIDRYQVQTSAIWTSLLNSKLFDFNDDLNSNTALSTTIEKYEDNLIETILTNTKDNGVLKVLVNLLLDKLRMELKSKDPARKHRVSRLINIFRLLASVSTNDSSEECNAEHGNFDVIRRNALEGAIEILQVCSK